MAKPRTTNVPPYIATLIYPSIAGLSSFGELRFMFGTAGYIGTDNTVTDQVNGFYVDGGHNDFKPSLPLLGVLSAMWFYHTTVTPEGYIQVWAWMP